MCLWKNDEATEKFRKKNKKMVVVWKTYTVYAYDDTAYSPYMNNGPIGPGIIESDRDSINHNYGDYLYSERHEIKRGIHVFLTRKEARKLAKLLNGL